MKHGGKKRSNTRKILNNNTVHPHARTHAPTHYSNHKSNTSQSYNVFTKPENVM